RRHTRFSRDWSSDVCSSDLPPAAAPLFAGAAILGGSDFLVDFFHVHRLDFLQQFLQLSGRQGARLREQQHLLAEHHQGGNRADRSEERRVGKGWRGVWSAYL